MNELVPFRQLPVNGQAVYVGTGSHLSDLATYQDLTLVAERTLLFDSQRQVGAHFRRSVQFVFLPAGNIPEETYRASEPA